MKKVIIELCGKESLPQKKVVDIIKKCNSRGIRCSILTNGLFIEREYIDKLVITGLNQIILPLDSVNPHTHDHIRGKESFEKIWEIMDYISTKYNEQDLLILETRILKQNLE